MPAAPWRLVAGLAATTVEDASASMTWHWSSRCTQHVGNCCQLTKYRSQNHPAHHELNAWRVTQTDKLSKKRFEDRAKEAGSELGVLAAVMSRRCNVLIGAISIYIANRHDWTLHYQPIGFHVSWTIPLGKCVVGLAGHGALQTTPDPHGTQTTGEHCAYVCIIKARKTALPAFIESIRPFSKGPSLSRAEASPRCGAKLERRKAALASSTLRMG